jgi:outer membrane protein assembly factor BamB
MSSLNESNSPEASSQSSAKPDGAMRVWPAAGLVAAFWAFYAATGMLDLGNFAKFMARFAAVAILLLAFVVWWLMRRQVRWRERLAVLAAAVAGAVVALGLLRDASVVAPAVLYYATPAIITAWTAWLVATRRSTPAKRRLGMFALPLVAWGASALVRMDGLSGENTPEFHWRWSPTAEAQFLAERVRFDAEKPQRPAVATAAAALAAGPHDWPRFRGTEADGAVQGVRIAEDWSTTPPKLRWRRRIGPGWSSITVVAGRLFTQEQRGEAEAVVCLDAVTGDELWSHENKVRFYEELGGVGPRATPTFAGGKIYALGATGILDCLDAATGALIWSQDIVPPEVKAAESAEPDAEESGKPKRPIWGYASSPLAIGGVVIVFAGGDHETSLVAYDAESGELAWKGDAGRHTYSSPQAATVDGVSQVLFVSNDELTSLDPATGKNIWRFESAFKEYFPSIQPHMLGSDVLFSFTEASGVMRVNVEHDGDAWKVTPVWKNGTRDLKPYFNDFVRYEDALYGFDGALFASVDLKTGKRNWKKGRYGAGQVLLLADQGLLLVLTEKGEVVLLAADSKEHRELGRFQAINGKTWNHPTLVDHQLFVRNAEEVACYELP